MITSRIYLASVVQSEDEEIGLYSVLDEHRDFILAPSRRVWGALETPDDMWMLANISAADHTPFLNDDRIDVLPDYHPDTLIANLPGDDVASLLAIITSHNMPATVLTDATTWYGVIDRIGRHLLRQPWNVPYFFAI